MTRWNTPARVVLWVATLWSAQSEAAQALPERLISLDDVAQIRHIGSLRVSPNRERFAIFVTHGDPAANEYKTEWYVADLRGEELRRIGDGGAIEPLVSPSGYQGGDLETRASRWSPDGRSLVYPLKRNGELQLWWNPLEERLQRQLSHNAADVRAFEWSRDGKTVLFTTGPARSELSARARANERSGYRYDDGLLSFADFMLPAPATAPDTMETLWAVDVEGGREYLASSEQIAEFRRLTAVSGEGMEQPDNFLTDAAVAPLRSADESIVWLKRIAPFSPWVQLVARLPEGGETSCRAEVCQGAISKVWWDRKGTSVIFWRNEGINDRGHALYVWAPRSGRVRTVARLPDDHLALCDLGMDDRVICVRDTKSRPVHVVSIDVTTGKVAIVADVNPQMRDVRLGRIERFEWDTPDYAWNEAEGELRGAYPRRAYGYIMYPPDFDPKKKYPVFLDPYAVVGFEASAGSEHALHVYAANGFVVVNAGLPMPTRAAELLGASQFRKEYSQELGFPHLTMLSESTLRALDLAIARGFIDAQRVGSGGVSHGSFIPLYLVQKHPQRIAALSISGPNWGLLQYYFSTPRGRGMLADARKDVGYEDWVIKPEGPGREFWRQIDIADHVDELRTPILMNLAAFESFGLLRLLRHLGDAGKPYDAYIFRDETHFKWQPAHLRVIQERNLDWFRFWLQGHEDPNARKAEQYEHWRRLRERKLGAASPERSEAATTPRLGLWRKGWDSNPRTP